MGGTRKTDLYEGDAAGVQKEGDMWSPPHPPTSDPALAQNMFVADSFSRHRRYSSGK